MQSTDLKSELPEQGRDSGLVLVSHVLCPYVQRARIILLEKGVAHDRVFIDLADKPQWFRRISPLGKVPLLRVEQPGGGEEVLFESVAITEYLDETTPGPLMPADPLTRARDRAWVLFASATLDAIGGLYNAPDRAAFREKSDVLHSRFKALEAALSDGPFFGGDRFGHVDAAFGPVFRYFDVFEERLGLHLLTAQPKIGAWRARLRARPSVRQAAVDDYADRLSDFLARRGSYISGLVEGPEAPPELAKAG